MAENKQKPNNKKFHQGYYQAINPHKYVGDVNSIIYRSGYELKMMTYLDKSDRVIRWGSEVNEIPYIDHEGKSRRYYPDFYMVIKPDSGEERMIIVEVKPEADTKKPEPPKSSAPKTLINYQRRVNDYLKNICKWQYAKDYCEKKGLEFMIITESFLYNKK